MPLSNLDNKIRQKILIKMLYRPLHLIPLILLYSNRVYFISKFTDVFFFIFTSGTNAWKDHTYGHMKWRLAVFQKVNK